MTPHTWPILLFFLFTPYNLLTRPPKNHTPTGSIDTHFLSAEQQGAHKIDDYHTYILRRIKSEKLLPTNKELLDSTISLLAFSRRYPDVYENQKNLKRSIKYFWGTVGYLGTLMAFLRDLDNPVATAKGRLYEIQCAVTLHRNQKKEAHSAKRNIVRAFNVHKAAIACYGSTTTREFDIITDRLWIECKDRNFYTMPLETKNSKYIRAQLLEQKLIVELYNQQHSTAVCFQLNSKQPLPEHWKKWLTHHQISFVEGH